MIASATNSLPVPQGARETHRRHLREGKFKVVAQGRDDHVALAAIGLDLSGQVLVEGDDAGVLGHARGTDKAELLELGHLLNQRRRTVGVAQSPAGHAVGLAEAVDHQDIVVPGRRRGERLIVAERPVNLVADQEHVPLLAELGQGAHLLGRGDDAGRVTGELTITHLVRAVIAASTCSVSIRKSG